MKRRILIPLLMALCVCSFETLCAKKSIQPTESTRAYWVRTLNTVARPVIEALSKGELKATMPIETKIDRAQHVAYLEAFGRTLCGIAPWLNLGADDSEEGKLRGEYIEKVKRCLDYATRPDSPDFMNFTTHQQPLVDAAFLAHGLLRSKAQVWDKLEPRVQQQVIDCLKSTRAIRTPQNNWLLFSGILEAFLVEVGEGGDLMRIDFAVTKHLERYKGDGVYGDGEEFHWDYYNSFVIQPMLVDVLGILHKHQLTTEATYNSVVRRMTRYAAVLERSISPEGTFPPMGRSLCYRIGVFQALGQAALSHQLPVDLDPAQVRCAMTAVIRRMMDAPGTYNEQGWLTIGFVGAQPSMGENYVNTGSLYLCCAGFLPLGLPESDPFWSNPDQEWTSVKLWKGQDMKADHML